MYRFIVFYFIVVCLYLQVHLNKLECRGKVLLKKIHFMLILCLYSAKHFWYDCVEGEWSGDFSLKMYGRQGESTEG